MTNRVATETATTWWMNPKWARQFWPAYSAFSLLFLVVILLTLDEPSTPTWATGAGLVITGVSQMVACRMRTMANADGVCVVNLRTRRMSWNDIKQFDGDKRSRWSTQVRVRIGTGEEYGAPGVPPEDTHELERWRPPIDAP